MSDPRRNNLGYFFSDTATRVPSRTAIVDLWGGERREFSFRQLDRQCDRVAAFFQAHGAQPGDRVALLVGNRCEYIESFFGLMRAGLVSVPLNPKQAESNLEFMLQDSGAIGVIIDPEACPAGAAIADRLGLRLKVMLSGQTTSPGVARPAGWLPYEAALLETKPVVTPLISPDGLAFQPYTAGSTGKPKGVRLRHEGMLWSIRSTEEKWPTSPDEVGLVCVPLFHKNAMRGTVKPNLFAGARTVLMPKYEPREFLTTLASERATYCGGVPAIFSMILQHEDLIARLDFSALKLLVIGSAVVPTELVRNLNRAFPWAKVKESYGLTEGGGPLRGPVDGRPTPAGSAGLIAEGYEVKLVAIDNSHGAEEGELWTRSPCVTDGYHNLPELSRERIVDGWLRTGDLFRVDQEGFFYFRGRVDDMFSCGGENIYPREVESLLLGHPDVVDACVVPVPHSVKGLVPCAMVVLRPGTAADGEALKAYSLSQGPAYAHPRRVMIIDSIPLSAAGKPDKVRIRELLQHADD